jgi:hypothetical protein
MLKTVLFAITAGLSAAYTDDALKDQVTNLPGSENIDISFNQFSGYLTVGDTKQLHYWLVESMSNPATDPVAFWTNGGVFDYFSIYLDMNLILYIYL